MNHFNLVIHIEAPTSFNCGWVYMIVAMLHVTIKADYSSDKVIIYLVS